MSDTVVHRPARQRFPTGSTQPVRLAPPPPLADTAGRTSWTYALFPVLGSAGTLVLALRGGNPLYLLAGVVFVLGSVGMGVAMALQGSGRGRGQRLVDRTRYLAHVRQTRNRLGVSAADQRAEACGTHPDPAGLLGVAASVPRLWERRLGDDDFLLLRVGTGRVPATAAPVLGESDPMRVSDPVCQNNAERLVEAYGYVRDVPVAVPVRPGTTTVLVGRPVDTRALARAMLGQLVALHAPEDVRVALCAPAGAAAEEAWAWLAWLPHVRHPTTDRLLLARDAAGLAELLAPELNRRRNQPRARDPDGSTRPAPGPALVVVVDGVVAAPDPLASVRALGCAELRLVQAEVQRPARVDLTLTLTPSTEGRGPDVTGLPGVDSLRGDAITVADADVLARELAPLRLSPRAARASLARTTGLVELLGVADLSRLDPRALWEAQTDSSLLRVPIGTDAEGRPVELDLKESASDGMGPHGLVVGATGSGKSELLRTLVTGLALTHSPQTLALVLVDFKGGATFAGLAGLPHVAGAVSDLSQDAAGIDRMGRALRGELRRREELLRDAGNLASIREHRQLRLDGADLAPMPHLLVVVDEFTELLTQQPDLIDVFTAIGRLGRSLGVHLLLATQRLEEGRLRGLDSHLSYRVALRTLSAGESRSVIGNADAFELPAVPGSAYLKVDTTVHQRLKVATVSLPYSPKPAGPQAVQGSRLLTAFEDEPVPLPPITASTHVAGGRSTLEMVVARLATAAPPVHQVWLPPLPRKVTLCSITPDIAAGCYQAPIGVVDLPDRQRQEVFRLDLTAEGGHLGIAGAPQTGKTTLLRTLVTSLALAHSPVDLQVYCLDLGGGLAGLADLPHVGAVVGLDEPERMRRTVAQLTALLAERERAFARHRIESVAAWRRRRAGLPADDYGEVVLVVDGWAALRTDLEDLEQPVTALALRGAGFGLHVVVASARWLDLRPALRDAIGTRLELRLGEPADSAVDRNAAKAMPSDIPGRLLAAGGHIVQVALPEADLDDPEWPGATAARIRVRWPDQAAPAVRLLPALVRWQDIPPDPERTEGVAIGLRECDLRPAYVDLVAGRDPHLLVVGDAGAGKTTALRAVVRAMTSRYPAGELLVVVVDYRRTLLDAVDDAHLSQYCGAAPVAAGTLRALAERLSQRLPGPAVTAAQLRAGGWWTGPRALVVVDDHDLVAGASGDPLGPLLELLPFGRDIGLHVVLARAAGGVAGAAGQPVFRRLRELGTAGLLLSGSRDEGVVLHGCRLQDRPPGRALYVGRGRAGQVVQVAWTPEPADVPGHALPGGPAQDLPGGPGHEVSSSPASRLPDPAVRGTLRP